MNSTKRLWGAFEASGTARRDAGKGAEAIGEVHTRSDPFGFVTVWQLGDIAAEEPNAAEGGIPTDIS
jgi:hypothetical protein